MSRDDWEKGKIATPTAMQQEYSKSRRDTWSRTAVIFF